MLRSSVVQAGGVVRSVRLGLATLLLVAGCSPRATAPSVTEPSLEIPRIDGGSGEPSSGGIRFGRAAPVVGSRYRVSVEAESVAVDPQGGSQLSAYVSSYTVEILGTNGPAPSRVRLSFERNVQRYQGVDKPTAIDGKTYVVDASPPHVRDDSGGQAPEEEAERVLDVFPDLGTRTRIDQVLPEAAMEVGDERDELAGAILRVIHPRAWTLEKGAAALSRVEGAEAVFTIAIAATGASGLRMDVRGEARVRLADARLVALALEGAYDQPGGGASEPGSFVLRRVVKDL